MMPNVEIPRRRDTADLRVNRDRGIPPQRDANGVWLRRLVRHHGLRSH